ncbi:hypothetical protein AB0G04_03035 [Actinoplanes sp. NPDC023801]|uniref:hypothetical protein n=1 Tax=Actinoplanes sp. NPDC023801 TaxID=3154595 RepID=UPI0033C8FABD
MSYLELAEHSVKFEELAIHASLRAQGFNKSGGTWHPPLGAEDAADLIVASTYRRYTGVAQMFTPFFGLPGPNDLQETYLRLESAQAKLSTGGDGYVDPASQRLIGADPVMNGMSAVEAAMQDWRGVAAEQFKGKFLKPWPAVTANQFTLLAVLAGAIKAEIALWTEARRNVDEIAHLALTALQSTGGIGDPKMEVFALTVAASVFSVGAAAIATTAAATSLTLTVAGAAAQAAGAVPREDAPKVAIDGGTAQGIVDQTLNALNALAFEIHQKETEIAYGLAMGLVVVTSHKDLFTAVRPWLADQTSTTITTDSGLGENL